MNIEKRVKKWVKEASDREELTETIADYLTDADEADVYEIAEYLAGKLMPEHDDENEEEDY